MANDYEKTLDVLQQALLSVAIRENWGYHYAKFSVKSNQSLLVHSLNAFSVAKELGKILFDLSGEEILLGCLGAFLHDYQKAEARWQEAAIAFMHGERSIEDGTFDHDDGSEGQMQRLMHLLELIENEIPSCGGDEKLTPHAKRVLNLIVYTHDTENRAASSRRRSQVGPADALVPLVRLSDSIASMKEPKDIITRKKDLALPVNKKVSFDYHELSSIRGLVTSFLNEAIIEAMKKIGHIPVAYFGKGAAYVCIGEPKSGANMKVHLEKALDVQVEGFRASDVYRNGMTNAVIGPLTQTKWPCIQLVREHDIPEIIRYLSAMPAMNKDEEKHAEAVSTKSTDAQKQHIAQFVKRCGAKQESDGKTILAMMTSDFNLLVYVADFLKGYREFAEKAGQAGEYEHTVDELLSGNELGFTVEYLRGISHTTPTAPKDNAVNPDKKTATQIDAISKLWDVGGRNLHLDKDRRQVLESRFTSVLKGTLKEYVGLAPKLFTHEALNLLLADIEHLPSQILTTDELKKFAHSTSERYLKGKNQSDRICSFCGAGAAVDAPATLFGDGSQKFSNFIPGGTNITAGRKAQVCPLCMLESTLRAFYFPSAPATTLVVIPDISLSPTLATQWAESVDAFTRTEMVGLSPAYVWNMNRVYLALVRDEPVDNASALAAMLRPINSAVQKLKKYLEAEWGSHTKLRYTVLTSRPEDTLEDIARAHMSGQIAIDPNQISDFPAPQRSQGTAYMTPSHMFIFFKNPLYLDKDESHSTVAIRTYLLALIISKVFHARVIVVNGFQPISDLSMKGVVRIQVPAPAAMALSKLGISGETQLHELRNSLRRLAAITLISMGYVEGLGKDRLLRLATMNRGAILRRSELHDWSKLKQWQKRRLIDLLGMLSAVAEDRATATEETG